MKMYHKLNFQLMVTFSYECTQMCDGYFVVKMKVMASDVAAASLSHQQRKRSLNARKNKGAAVKTVLCTPYVAKWLVVLLLIVVYNVL